MADPILTKISELPELTATDAADLLPIVDVSEPDAINRTKRTRMDKLKLSSADQLADGIVANSKLAEGAVTSGKLGTGAVIAGKIATGGVSASAQIADGVVETAKLADSAVTEAKLGAIKRTVIIPVFGDEDAVIVKNFPRRFAWPAMLNGDNIIAASAVISGAVSTSGSVVVAVTNAGGTVSTISIAAGQWSASGTVNTTYQAASTLNPVGINVTGAGTGAKGLSVYLELLG